MTIKMKWRAMNGFRRGCLLLQVAVVLLATLLGPVIGRREGIAYGDKFFPKTVRGDATVYTGKYNGNKTTYTVRETPEGYSVDCQIADQSFGPYTVKEISTAGMSFGDFEHVSDGVEIWEGDKLLFRGGYFHSDETAVLVEEGGRLANEYGYTVVNGIAAIEPPNANNILLFATSAGTAHRGNVPYYLMGLLVAALNMVDIFYAEEFFIWHMSFHVNSPETVEPSDWELFWRHAGWAIFIAFSLFCFAVGLFIVA